MFETDRPRVVPLFAASLQAAIIAGDAAPGSIGAANSFWFAQHVAAMMAFAALPRTGCIPYQGSLDELVEEASAFILRGIGIGDAAIAAGAASAPADGGGLSLSRGAIMDGDLETPPFRRGGTRRPIAAARRSGRRPARAARRRCAGRSLSSVLLAVVLGGLYGFNRYREHAIANFFAHNKPPPAEIAAVTATTASVPHFAAGIGSLAAVHQVTVTPEIGGRVTAILFQPGATVKAGDPLVSSTTRPTAAISPIIRRRRAGRRFRWSAPRLLAQRQFGPQETVDQTQSQLDQARAQIAKTEAVIAQKLVRAPFAGRLGVRQIDLGQYLTPARRS